MKHDEFRQKLPDYALDLLSPQQLVAVEHHLAQCTSCQQALQHERKIAHLIRSSVSIASRPDVARLRELMPAPPKKKSVYWKRSGWQKQLAPVMLVLFLSIGVFLTQISKPSGSLPAFVSTAYAATATSTNTPTATTSVQSVSLEESTMDTGRVIIESSKQIAPKPSSFPQTPVTTPEPQPTPVAAAAQLSVQ
ncbi:MAG: zf-HC2 domain-containing protein [Candidatus Promineifilaceae bacterium]|nr:zf-HC2 domain-containing protein [Candidatus Promineifilaceae bacterium]